MRQLITRIDDDLHARLKDVAQRQGRSVNSVVVEALETVAGEPVDPGAALRRRLADLGMLVVPPKPDSAPTREELAAESRGTGRAVTDALFAERDER